VLPDSEELALALWDAEGEPLAVPAEEALPEGARWEGDVGAVCESSGDVEGGNEGVGGMLEDTPALPLPRPLPLGGAEALPEGEAPMEFVGAATLPVPPTEALRSIISKGMPNSLSLTPVPMPDSPAPMISTLKFCRTCSLGRWRQWTSKAGV
jgi:hypothetical protein